MNWQFVSAQVDAQLKRIRQKAKDDLSRFDNFGKLALRVTDIIRKHKERKEKALNVLDFAEGMGGTYNEVTGNYNFKHGEDLDVEFFTLDETFMNALYDDMPTRVKLKDSKEEMWKLVTETKDTGEVYPKDHPKEGEAIYDFPIKESFQFEGIETDVLDTLDKIKDSWKNEDIIYHELLNPKTKKREPSMVTPNEKSMIDTYGNEYEVWLHDQWSGKTMINPEDPDGPEIKAYFVDPVSATFAALSYLSGVSSKTKAARAKQKTMESALTKVPGMRHSLRQKVKDIDKTAKIQTDKFKNKVTDISAQTEAGYAEVMNSLDYIGRKQGALTSGDTERMIEENLAATLYAAESATESTKQDWDAFNIQVDQQQDSIGEEMSQLSAKEREWQRELSQARKHNKFYKNLI